jgi:hypothetical protein
MDCPICLDPIGIVVTLNACRHSFCRRCITEWHHSQEGNKTCPVCRTPYNPAFDLFYSRYEDRLASFLFWPALSPVTAEELAANGFHYIGRIGHHYPNLPTVPGNDWVSCSSCKIKLGLWKEGDSVVEEHRKYSRGPCFFLDHE